MVKNILIAFLLTAFLTSCGQDRSKAESAVRDFMKKSTSSYQPGDFGEFFVQTYPDEVQKKIGTNKKVKYSLVHSFKTDSGEISDMYFHLTDKYGIVGKLTSQQMMDLTMDIAGPKLDSIMNFLTDSLSKEPSK
jgi:hypothetical protein